MLNRLTIMEKLLSDENIFLALYSVESYIQDRELLSDEDKRSLIILRDKFNELIISDWIALVKRRLESVLSEGEYLKTKVYFKPKKYKSNGHVVFRPLHMSPLVDQIASVAMMNVLIYEFDKENRISASSLSRLIPHNFYGNRVAFEPENLFKPWKEQYKKYTSKANEYYRKFHDNLEYKWEVNLDLENFFPSINPVSLINYVDMQLPVTYSLDERKLINKILEKLIYVELENMTIEDLVRYTGQKAIESCKFAIGLPQGLPQSYFLANFFMIEIERVYKKHIPGEMLFYVDDSVVFTNEIIDIEDFAFKITAINNDISEWVENLYKRRNLYLSDDVLSFTDKNKKMYKINIHPPEGKSTISNILDSKEGENYIHCIGRETSKTAFEINTSFSDEESRILYNKTTAILEAIENELEKTEENLLRQDLLQGSRKNYEAYRKKLIRYRKFFKYRNKSLEFRENTDISKLEKELLDDLEFLDNDDMEQGLKVFFDKYNEDTLGASIGFVLRAMKDVGQNYKTITDKICKLNEKLFGYDNRDSSYLYVAYKDYIMAESENVSPNDSLNMRITKYSNLSEIVKWKMKFANNKTDKVCVKLVKDILDNLDFGELISKYIGTHYLRIASLVLANSNTLQRMLLNALFSCILKIDISDETVLQKVNNRKIKYFELRLLELLRNEKFKLEELDNVKRDLISEEYYNSIDYSIMQVIGIFRTFVRNPLYIDNLILVHKYTCDIWKNGSKYLYFYTLHNQEHAVDLIQNSVKILRAIDYIDISVNDYYVLFIACYLHDISMVTLPDLDLLQMSGYEADKIYSDFIKEMDISKLAKKEVLKLLKDYYMRIDSFYEGLVRNSHAKDSAAEIRNRSELGFIDSSLREIVAEVSEAHGYSVNDIYKIKSVARSKLWSSKFTKIILRLADLLDMSSYRVSKLILDHNLENMGETSRFHWLSHLITSKYEIEVKYHLEDNREDDFLQQGSIVEDIKLIIEVSMPQITGEKPCNCIHMKLRQVTDTSIEIECGNHCNGSQCNFLCKWFSKKNEYLFMELAALQKYLNDLPDNYFKSMVTVSVVFDKKSPLTPKQFSLLKKYVSEH